MKFPKKIINNSLPILSIFCGLLITDISMYLLFKRKPAQPQHLYVNDSELGYRLNPGFSGNVETKAGNYKVNINSDGFRDKEWPAASTNSILFLGDSFTYGMPLEREQTFVSKLSKRFPKLKIYNLGVPGYGPIHANINLDRYCQRLKPSRIFYMYYLNDTAIDNVQADYYTVIDGFLAKRYNSKLEVLDEQVLQEHIKSAKAIKFERPWNALEWLSLYNIRDFLSSRGIHPSQLLSQALSQKKADPLKRLASADPNNTYYTDESIKKAANQIDQLQQKSKACGALFILVILPTYEEAFYKIQEPATNKFLSLLANKIDILDIREHIPKGTNLKQWYDSHYSDKGTEQVSLILSDHIKSLQ